MIRRAVSADIPALNNLLSQVLNVHASARPDIFKQGAVKYSNEKLRTLLETPNAPIFVYIDENNNVVGYAFCQYRTIKDNPYIHDIKYCYIDDICVDKELRRKGIGTKLYEYVKAQAQKDGYQEIRLNVWCLNESAIRFYEKLGLNPLAIIMQQKI